MADLVKDSMDYDYYMRYTDTDKILADIEDPRKSTLKALPPKPNTPRTVMHKFRFSAVFPIAFAVVSFALTIVLVLSGTKPGMLEEQYMIALNTSKVGQNVIRFEPATSTPASKTSSTSSSATSSSNPLDMLNPLSTASPLNPNNPNNPLSNLSSALDPLVSNITSSIDGSVEDAINEVIATMVDAAGVKDYYFFYLEKVCEADLSNSSSALNGASITTCSSYDSQEAGLNDIVRNLRSNVTVGTSTISVPMISTLTSSFGGLTDAISGLRKAVFAFLIISLIVSALSAINALIAIFFPRSRLLVYAGLGWSSLASFLHFLAACILTGIIVAMDQAINGIGDAVSLQAKEGNMMMLFIWLGWLFMQLIQMFWFGIWFVEVRSWSFVRRRRTLEQKESYRGAVRELLDDLTGKSGKAM